MLLVLAVLLMALAVETFERIEPVEESPLAQGTQLATLALHPGVVRVEGVLVPEDGASPAPLVLERVQVDSGRYPRPDWRAQASVFLLHQRLPSYLDYDMVSPPRIGLQVGDTVVSLQTEDIDLSCWLPTVEARVSPGGPYPAEVLTLMLASLPDLPPVTAAGQVVVRTFKPQQAVIVIGEVAKDGDLTVLRAPDHGPFVVSSLPYADIQSRLRSVQHGWEVTTAALVLAGLLMGGFALSGRPRT
jgi:hypothetical protein